MLCVVSHDAGGAEVLASYVARNAITCEFVLEGPAVKVFERRLGAISTTSLSSAFERCDEFLTGSSWQSELERHAIVAAKQAGKRTVTFLDHWANYRERFILDGAECLPDSFWVGDAIAEQLAHEAFPETPIQLVPNPYFEDIRDEFAKTDASELAGAAEGLRVLFVCEPLSEHGLKEYGDERYWGYTEFDALRYFFANRIVLGSPLAGFVIRPHPSEFAGKYDQIAKEFGKVACIGGQKSLLQEIAESDVVVGCESMAMVIGLIAGRRVISVIPPEGKRCSLPQPEIESLRTLVQDGI